MLSLSTPEYVVRKMVSAISSAIENSAFLNSSSRIGSSVFATLVPSMRSASSPRVHMLAPRALTGQSTSTRPLRTPTYQSCRLTVGSQ